MLDEWARGVGGSETTQDGLLIIGLHGGWPWWNGAARAANAMGDHILAARMFLFMDMVIHHDRGAAATGLSSTDWQHFEAIAAVALDSLFQLNPGLLVHDTAIARITVTDAIRLAARVTASSRPAVTEVPPPGVSAPASTVRLERRRRSLVAIALGVVLMLGGFLLGVRPWEGETASSTPATPPQAGAYPAPSPTYPASTEPVTPAPATTPPAQPSMTPSPTRVLHDGGFGPLAPVAQADRPWVEANLLDRWTVQVEAVAMRDGPTQQQRYREMTTQYPTLKVVNSNSYASFKTADYWVFVSGEVFDDADAANAWCAGRGLPADSCFARRLSFAGTNESNARTRA